MKTTHLYMRLLAAGGLVAGLAIGAAANAADAQGPANRAK